jgi:hypothetical protein
MAHITVEEVVHVPFAPAGEQRLDPLPRGGDGSADLGQQLCDLLDLGQRGGEDESARDAAGRAEQGLPGAGRGEAAATGTIRDGHRGGAGGHRHDRVQRQVRHARLPASSQQFRAGRPVVLAQ